MLSVSLALWLAQARSDDPVERLEAFLAATPELRAEFSLTETSRTLTGVSERGPAYERVALETPAGPIEYRQTADGLLVMDHAQRTYARHAPYPEFLGPPDDADPFLSYSRPWFLRPGWFRADPDGPEWQAQPGEPGEPPQWESVRLTLPVGSRNVPRSPGDEDPGPEGDGGKYTVTVDQVGHPVRFVADEPTPGGRRVRTWRFTRVSRVTDGSKASSLAPPWGYEPNRLASYRRPWRVGDSPPEVDVPFEKGGAVSLKVVTRVRPTVFLFTSGECEPSRASLPFWGKVAERARRSQARLIHIALDGAPTPEGWERIVDASGRVETAFQVPQTPYAITLAPGGSVLGSWPGYGLGEDDEAADSLLRNLEKGLERLKSTGG